MNGRLSDRLRRFYDPRTLPAPLGRNPDGWPLLGCGTCSQPIPWRKNQTGNPCLESPRIYYARQFCDRRCQHEWDGNEVRAAQMRTMIPKLLDPWTQLPLRDTPEFARPLPTLAEIDYCAKCHARGPFSVEAVGKKCFVCGYLNFARDAEWASERASVR